MAQWLRVLTALTEDRSSAPSTHVRRQPPITPVLRNLMHYGLYGHLHAPGSHRFTHAYTYT